MDLSGLRYILGGTYSTSGPSHVAEVGFYWTSTLINQNQKVYGMFMEAYRIWGTPGINPQNGAAQWAGYGVRCVRTE